MNEGIGGFPVKTSGTLEIDFFYSLHNCPKVSCPSL